MTEILKQETLPGMSEVELLEALDADSIVDHILEMGKQVTELEKKMNTASDVLEGAYGLTVEDVLARRESQHSTLLSGDGEKQNGEQE